MALNLIQIGRALNWMEAELKRLEELKAMSIEKSIAGIQEYLDQLVSDATAKAELDDAQAQQLVELEQEIHDKLSVIFDKFDVAIGDERND